MASYRYKPLNPLQQEIRLLSILPAPSGGPISCQIHTTTLRGPREYSALSYVWAQAVSSPGCLPTVSLDGTVVPVTKSLSSALQHLRPSASGKPLWLWVDALCINQQDDVERSQQVSIMRDVYASAEQTIIWLGEADAESDTAFGALALCASPTGGEVDKTMRTTIMKQVSSFFFTLVDRFPWFSRVWILQELAVTRTDPVVVCGLKSAPWSLFFAAWDSIATEIFVEMGMVPTKQQTTSSISCNGSGNGAATSTELQSPDDKAIFKRPEVKIDVLNHLRTVIRQKGRESLSQLLRISRTSMSSDPRDRIYGLLGLSDHTEPTATSVPIDYQKSVSEVYTDAMIHLLARGEGLFFLSGSYWNGVAGMPRNGGSLPILPYTLPSWVPDFSRQTAQSTSQPAGHLFYPPATPGFRLSGASGPGALCINGKCLDDKQTLQVEGLIVGCVKQVVYLGHSLDAWIAKLPHLRDLAMKATSQRGSNAGSYEKKDILIEKFRRSEPLWRVLVSDKKYNSGYDPAPDSYKATYDKLLREPGRTQVGVSDTETETSEYERCLKTGVGKRSFLVLDNGFIGTCVPETREGDIVVILFGSPIPFVLRRLEETAHSGSGQKEAFALAGGAYIGGIMKGEMVDELYCEDLVDSATFFIR